MAVYLLANEIGADAAVVGFPSLMGCMAVVLQTDTKLFRWHVYGSGRITERVGFFEEFIQSDPHRGNAVALFGVCNFLARFGGDGNAWRAEMNAVVAGLHFSGFKRWSKMHHTRGNLGEGVAQRRIISRDGGTTYTLPNLWTNSEGETNAATGVDIVRTRSNKGRLHHAPVSRFQTFTAD